MLQKVSRICRLRVWMPALSRILQRLPTSVPRQPRVVMAPRGARSWQKRVRESSSPPRVAAPAAANIFAAFRRHRCRLHEAQHMLRQFLL